jgi:hypothetical protein
MCPFPLTRPLTTRCSTASATYPSAGAALSAMQDNLALLMQRALLDCATLVRLLLLA